MMWGQCAVAVTLLLASFGGNKMSLKMVPDVLKAELHAIAKIVLSTIEGLPIAKKNLPSRPSLLLFSTPTLLVLATLW